MGLHLPGLPHVLLPLFGVVSPAGTIENSWAIIRTVTDGPWTVSPSAG